LSVTFRLWELISHLEQQKAEIEEALAELRARRAGMAAAA
jgi:hypothetical protein